MQADRADGIAVSEAWAGVIRRDGWENVILGLGGTKDPSAYTTISQRPPLPDELLEALYVEDHFAARIVEAVVRDAMRPGWDLRHAGEQQEAARARDAFATREEELGVLAKMAEGASWGRVFGGALTWIGADDGRDAEAPLDEETIASVRFLHSYDRRDVRVAEYYQDPKHPKFRQPSVFQVWPRTLSGQTGPGAAAAGGAKVHESRCVVWGGQSTTDTRRQLLSGWDDSVLERCWDALRQVAEDYGAKSMLLGRVSQAIYKIRELYAMIAGKREEILRARIGMLDASRSRGRAIVLDAEEEFVNVTQPLTGVDTLLDRALLRLAAAAGMPVAVLLGQPLSQLAGTNAGDLEVWSQQVEAWRQLELRPRHERIVQLILLAQDGPTAGQEPAGWRIVYRPLRVPSAKEAAEVRKLQAETDAIRVDKGFATPEAIALQRFAPSAAGDLVMDEKELTEALDRRKQLANQPPKDNAEIGTVGARSSAAIEIIEKVAQKLIPRDSGTTLLVELFRFTPQVAETMLGPADFEPAPPKNMPGPAPTTGGGAGGAGAPPQLPGVNAGGDPTKRDPVP
jgi:hypothetical protein